MRRGIFLGVAIGALVLASPIAAAPTRTDVRTIQDRDGDNVLEPAPGEDHVVLPEGRSRPRVTGSVLNFLQLSDFQTVDEESPARVEWLDFTQRGAFNPFSAAYRPQESLSTQVVESMVRQVRNTRSPITSAPPALTMLTGDNADSQQLNETRWFIDILDGKDTVNPDSGVPVPGCEATPGSPYDGVRGGGSPTGYYEPDASGEGTDGDGYSPVREENQAKTGRDVTVRDFPGLLDDAQRPFRALGLGMPWYSAFGNHDALVQGNSPIAYAGPLGTAPESANEPGQRVATGCVKVKQPAPDVQARINQLRAQIDALGTPSTIEDVQRGDELAGELARLAAAEQADPAGASVDIVPPDPRRCWLSKASPSIGPAGLPCAGTSWIDQHFDTTGTPQGHGFALRPPQAIANRDGYYSFSPRPGLRFLVLDTITDECTSGFCAEGTIDDTQFRWIEDELRAATARGEYVMVFSHHTLRTTRQPDDSDASEQPVHYGERVDRRSGTPQPPSTVETLEELYCRYPNVIAAVNGHEHENYVLKHPCDGAQPGFYEVSTAAHIDWPQQSRMIELVTTDTGELAMVLTMLDQDGPPNPGNAAGEQPLKLASIARELAYNDYQSSRGSRGGPADRNAIVMLGRPWPAASS